MNKGYIRLYRKMTEWDWYDDIPTKVLFIHLLFTVNWEDKKWHGQVVKKGELITSISHLAKQTKLSVMQIRTAIEKLKSTGEIKVESTNKYTKITVANYTKYQTDNKQKTRQKTDKQKVIEETQNEDNKQITNKQQTNNKQITTTKTLNTLNTLKNIYSDIQNLYNEICISLPQIKMISPTRKSLIDARLQDYTIDDFKKVFKLAEKSDFLSGRNGKWTNCNFDWLLKPNNFLKVIEGTYKNGKRKNIESREYDFKQLERQMCGGKKC